MVAVPEPWHLDAWEPGRRIGLHRDGAWGNILLTVLVFAGMETLFAWMCTQCTNRLGVVLFGAGGIVFLYLSTISFLTYLPMRTCLDWERNTLTVATGGLVRGIPLKEVQAIQVVTRKWSGSGSSSRYRWVVSAVDPKGWLGPVRRTLLRTEWKSSALDGLSVIDLATKLSEAIGVRLVVEDNA